MFERFSQEARAAVMAAQVVARETGTTRIDTRHILVALAEAAGPAKAALEASGVRTDGLALACRDELRSGGLDADALASLGIDLEEVRLQADATFGPNALDGTGPAPKGHIPFDRSAKKALELALRETIRLKQRSITGGTILLGILRAESPGRRVLERAGADLSTVRDAVESAKAA